MPELAPARLAPTTTNRSGPAATDANDAPAASAICSTAAREPPPAWAPGENERKQETGRDGRDDGHDTTARHHLHPSLGHWTTMPMTVWPDIIALFGSDRMLST